MRAVVKITLLALYIVVGLALAVQPTYGQTGIPLGQPLTFGSGVFPTQTVNQVIDYQNSIVPMPGQHVGMILPAWLRFMVPPKTTNIYGPGVSAVPSPAQYPGALFPQFPTVTKAK